MGLKVGVVRDQRYLEHKPGLIHPESPTRLKNVYRMLDRDFADKVITIKPELATLEDLELVHTPGYIKQILSTAERAFTPLSPDTYVSAKTYLAAWLAVGGCIEGLEALLSGRCRVCFSLVRPPGHHALPDRAGGFCIFDNLGVVARHAIERHGMERVLIIDWDIHHGNAIQDLFYSDPRVLYLSTHYMGWYPKTGDWAETGEGEGEGYTVNIPVFKELKDDDIIHIYNDILTPVVRRYRPQLILVAAGFDAHKRDPLGRTRLTEKAYYWLAQLVLQLSDAVKGVPILFSLEGGYDNWALTASVREVLSVLTMEGRRARIPVVRTEKAGEVIERVRNIHRNYSLWVG
ncbi:histone deacetylase [Thermodesulfobacteriota bacterium]